MNSVSYIMVSVEISSEYGYVVLLIPASWILINWLGLQVVKARKKFEIPVSLIHFLALMEHNVIVNVWVQYIGHHR